jgi:hypothetical protein
MSLSDTKSGARGRRSMLTCLLVTRRPMANPLRNQPRFLAFLCDKSAQGDVLMNGIIYLVGLIVIIMFILSFLGLR